MSDFEILVIVLTIIELIVLIAKKPHLTPIGLRLYLTEIHQGLNRISGQAPFHLHETSIIGFVK